MNENTIALFLNDSYLSVRFSVDVKKVVFNKCKRMLISRKKVHFRLLKT